MATLKLVATPSQIKTLNVKSVPENDVLERSRKVLDFKYLKQRAGLVGLAAELD